MRRSVIGADADQIEERIAAQLRRQQLLCTPGMTIQLVMGEGARPRPLGSRSCQTHR
jgi:hypothetical protein